METRRSGSGRASEDAFDASEDDPAVSVFARACLSRSMLENVAGKWGVLALLALSESPARFNALRRRVEGVSERMLAQTLRALEGDGLLVREVRSTIPPCVEYSLTPLGARAAAILGELASLLESHASEVIIAGRPST